MQSIVGAPDFPAHSSDASNLMRVAAGDPGEAPSDPSGTRQAYM
jgi:hypothetical protein